MTFTANVVSFNIVHGKIQWETKKNSTQNFSFPRRGGSERVERVVFSRRRDEWNRRRGGEAAVAVVATVLTAEVNISSAAVASVCTSLILLSASPRRPQASAPNPQTLPNTRFYLFHFPAVASRSLGFFRHTNRKSFLVTLRLSQGRFHPPSGKISDGNTSKVFNSRAFHLS